MDLLAVTLAVAGGWLRARTIYRPEPPPEPTDPGWRPDERTVAEGVEQTAAYMDRCGAEAGHLVVFDRSEERSWDEKVFRDVRKAESGTEIAVWGA